MARRAGEPSRAGRAWLDSSHKPAQAGSIRADLPGSAWLGLSLAQLAVEAIQHGQPKGLIVEE